MSANYLGITKVEPIQGLVRVSGVMGDLHFQTVGDRISVDGLNPHILQEIYGIYIDVVLTSVYPPVNLHTGYNPEYSNNVDIEVAEPEGDNLDGGSILYNTSEGEQTKLTVKFFSFTIPTKVWRLSKFTFMETVSDCS